MMTAINNQLRLSTWRQMLLVAAWLAAVGTGLALFQQYKATAGGFGQAPKRWPEKGSLRRADAGMSLLMFAHPRCPCTRASLNELAVVLARRPGDVEASVVFYRPDGADAAWTDADTVRLAAQMTGVRVVWDDGGRLAELYRVETSGHVLLFGRDGDLLFNGGITAIRGHEGGNPGRDALAACLGGKPAAKNDSPVFGCPLDRAQCEIRGQANLQSVNP